MAFPNEIQIGRLNGVLHKLLDMKEGAPSPQLTGEIVPTLCLETDRPEWKFLGGERVMMGRTVKSAVAAQVNHAQLFNPSGSDALIVLERLWCSSSTATGFLLGWASQITSAGGSQTKSYRDSRNSTTAGAGAGILHANSAAATVIDGPIIGDIYAAANDAKDFVQGGIIITPGFGIVVETVNVNVAMRVTWEWRERFLEPSEVR